MNLPDIQPVIDIAVQIGLSLGKVFIDLFLAIWNSLPSLSNESKGFLIGLVLLVFLIRILKSPTARYGIQDFLEKIIIILTK